MPVYFAVSEDGQVKIGWSKQPSYRLRALQNIARKTLCLRRTINKGREAEQWLHWRFSALRIQGEWFWFDEEMMTIDVPHDLPDEFEDITPMGPKIDLLLNAELARRVEAWRLSQPAPPSKRGALQHLIDKGLGVYEPPKSEGK